MFFHASSSAFYNWEEFKQISTGAWIENTKHGKQGKVRVGINDSNHPITKGINGFVVFERRCNRCTSRLRHRFEGSSCVLTLACNAGNANASVARFSRSAARSRQRQTRDEIHHGQTRFPGTFGRHPTPPETFQSDQARVRGPSTLDSEVLFQ